MRKKKKRSAIKQESQFSSENILDQLISLLGEYFGKTLTIIICACMALWWFWKDIIQRPLMGQLIDEMDSIVHPIQKPISDKLNVAIAKIINDNNQVIRTELATSLQSFTSEFNELGTKESHYINIAIVPLKIKLHNPLDHIAVQNGHQQAKKFLQTQGFDLLIWGFKPNQKHPNPLYTGRHWHMKTLFITLMQQLAKKNFKTLLSKTSRQF